ncbi:MAG: rRNA pseudouridine synthase [Clostridia bacterium]|nr:rRNA pseudouridine synthase [Clostridia bacterium]
MRLDKFLTASGRFSRKEGARAAASGEITVNGRSVRKANAPVEPGQDVVCYKGEEIAYLPHIYVMLNKPEGYVSATSDGREPGEGKGVPLVTSLLPEYMRKRGIFPCGRLDKDTVGLMILTDDGPLAHVLLSPKRHVAKKYGFRLDLPLPPGAEERFRRGVYLGEEKLKSAILRLNQRRDEGEIVLTQGKYHQIKRMMETEGSRVTFLERLSFGNIPLDPALGRGEWRLLTERETDILREAAAEGGKPPEDTENKTEKEEEK